MSSSHEESPFNPLPPIVVALAILIFGVEIVLQAGNRGFVGGPEAIGWRLATIREYAFSGPVFDWMLSNGRWPAEHLRRFVTYPFVHVSFTSMIFALVFLLALGKMVGEIFGTLAVLVIFFGSAIGGALAMGLLVDEEFPLIGAFPAVYGFIGTYTFMLWFRLSGTGNTQFRAFSLIAILMGIQLIFGLLFGSNRDWIADLFGFATGFFLTFLLVPGIWHKILDRLRQR